MSLFQYVLLRREFKCYLASLLLPLFLLATLGGMVWYSQDMGHKIITLFEDAQEESSSNRRDFLQVRDRIYVLNVETHRLALTAFSQKATHVASSVKVRTSHDLFIQEADQFLKSAAPQEAKEAVSELKQEALTLWKTATYPMVEAAQEGKLTPASADQYIERSSQTLLLAQNLTGKVLKTWPEEDSRVVILAHAKIRTFIYVSDAFLILGIQTWILFFFFLKRPSKLIDVAHAGKHQSIIRRHD